MEKYNGTTPVETFITKFQKCSDYMGWSDLDKVIHLTNSLTGTAELLIDGSADVTFEQLVEKLRRRFGSEEQYDRFRSLLKLRKRKDGETLQELALDIETMARLAYPNMGAMDHPMNDILLREALVDALDNPGFERKIREHQPKTFDNALTLALRLEALYKSQQAQKESASTKGVEQAAVR